jgi:hypothetical protein
MPDSESEKGNRKWNATQFAECRSIWHEPQRPPITPERRTISAPPVVPPSSAPNQKNIWLRKRPQPAILVTRSIEQSRHWFNWEVSSPRD